MGSGTFEGPGSKEIANRELENDGLLARERPERDTPLEAQRADGRKPAEAKAPALAIGAEVERRVARILAGIDVRGFELAVLTLEVERVAHVGEDHAADADLVEDRELDLRVAQHLHVAADQEVAQARVLGLLSQRLDDRPQRPRREAADVVDAAHEVALE